jgi:hypothetical protein
MPKATTHDGESPTPAKRITLSQIVELLLQRSPRDHSSVTLSRNAKGETQIEVVVRTGDAGEIVDVDDALAKAVELYDVARERYPMLPPAPAAGAK